MYPTNHAGPILLLAEPNYMVVPYLHPFEKGISKEEQLRRAKLLIFNKRTCIGFEIHDGRLLFKSEMDDNGTWWLVYNWDWVQWREDGKHGDSRFKGYIMPKL